MKGVLVVAHGSRAKETEKTLLEVLDIVRERLPDVIVEHAFMEFGDRTIEAGVAALVEKNVREVKIVPYFLFSGVHIKEDIPTAVEKCMRGHPGVKAVMGEPLGVDSRLAEIVVDRIRG